MPYDRENDRSTLHIYDLNDDCITDLITFDYLIEAPNWTQDGEALIYNSKGRLYRYQLSDGQITPIDTGFAVHCNNDHVLSPDGNAIAVSHGTAEDGQSRIYICSLQNDPTPHLITPLGESYLHGWSPDGQTLAYCAHRGDRYNLCTIPAKGGVETRLTDVDAHEDGPEFSPCGKYLWFNSTRAGLMQAYRMNCDGTDIRQMTFDDDLNTWFPHVSPDGKQVLLISYRKGDLEPYQHEPHRHVVLRIMPAEGGTPKTLVHLFGGQGTINVNSFSPCSQKFAYVSYEKTK